MKRHSSVISPAAQSSSEHAPIAAAWAQFQDLRKADSRSDAIVRPSLSVPGYRLLREIHRGGQGVVYLAIQESTRRKVAIKVLKEGPLADSREFARFDREIDILSRINHPHIVAIHERGLAAGHAYYTMDYIPGQPLDAYVVGAGLNIKDMLQLFIKLCDAVNVAHLRGVIHRDLKPANIRIDEAGEPKVLDFGLAKLVNESSGKSSAGGVTITGQFVGSLPWASPEQVQDSGQEIDIRTDVYSLGVILFQMLTGKFPYSVTGTSREVQDRILQAVALRPSSVPAAHQRGRIDADLDTIVLKCLTKQPERRYQSAGELSRDVCHYLMGEPIEAKRDSFAYVFRKQLGRHRGATALSATMVVMIVGGLAYCAAQWQRADREALRAKTAEIDAQTRADELEQVAEFQEAQLSEIDPQTMGARLRAALLAETRKTSERSKLTADESIAQVEELEKLIAGNDFTGIALGSLDDNFFKPTEEAIEKRFTHQPLIKARLLHALASTLQEVGHIDAATQLQEKALEIRQTRLGEEHPDTLASIDGLGELLKDQGKLNEAELYLRKAVEKRRRVLGEDHPDTLTSISNLGDLLLKQGKYSDAELCIQESLEKRRRILGDDHPDTIASLRLLGALRFYQGKLSEAELYRREVLNKSRQLLGEDHPDTIVALMNMGSTIKALGRLEEAEPYYRKTMEISRRVLGEEHPDTVTAISNLGYLLQARGKLEESGLLLREVLQTRRRLLGDSHPATLSAICNMGTQLQWEGKFAESETYCREALETRRRLLGDEHPDTLFSIESVGHALWNQRELGSAETFFRDVLEIRRRVLGNDHPDTLRSIRTLGKLLLDQKKLAEAEPLVREALDKQIETLGRDHPNTISSMNSLGILLKAQGRFFEAEPLLREALNRRRRVLGEDHPETINSIGSLGILLKADGRLSEAEEYAREALTKRRNTQGNDHRNTLVAIINLTTVLKAEGKWDEAQPLQLELMETRRRLLGAEHPDTLGAIASMGSLLLDQEKPSEVIALLSPAEPAVRRAFTGCNSARLGRLLTTLGRARIATGEFDAAKSNLDEAYMIVNEVKCATDQDREDNVRGLAELYDAWNAAEPDMGHEVKAAEWREKLNAVPAKTMPLHGR